MDKKDVVMTTFFVMVSILSTMAEGEIFIYSQDFNIIQEEFRDMPAKFGPVISTNGLEAYVVAGQPKDGCSPISKKPNNLGKFVVLLARYNCSFEQKVRAAQEAGFDGVIVHNVNSNTLEVMSAKNSDNITIPSVFIGEDAGVIIEYNYQYNNSYFVVINGDLPFNINHLLMPFSIIVVLCLVIMSIFMVVKCVRDRRRARRHRLPNSSLKKIPTSKFAKGDPYDTCAICLDDYVEGDKLRVLPCSHAYHCKCIDPWLTKNRRVCPVCKRKVFASGERRPRRNSSSASDTDDDRDPLVSSRSGNNTQGGTFNEQLENPIARATRERAARQNQEDTSGTSQETRGQTNTEGPQRGSWPESSTGSRGGPFLAGFLNLRDRLKRSRDEERQPLTNDDLLATESSNQVHYENETTASQSSNITQPSRVFRSCDLRPRAMRRHQGPIRQSSTSSLQENASNKSTAPQNDSTPVVPLTDRHSINGGNGDSDDVTYSNIGRIGVAALPNSSASDPI